MKETALLIGAHRALFGICTEAESTQGVGVIILNAGMLHHVGPFRLHVDLARTLAGQGIQTIRLDQSGKGESPARQGASFEESLLMDFDDTEAELRKRGAEQIYLFGLCSGADDALYIAQHRPAVAGLLFLDGYAARTSRYAVKRYGRKALDAGAWARAAGRVTQRLASNLGGNNDSPDIDLRNWASKEEMIAGHLDVLNNGTRILAIFTDGAADYYNYEGQLAEVLGDSPAVGSHLREIFFPDSDHLFTIVAHRQRLVSAISDWMNSWD